MTEPLLVSIHIPKTAGSTLLRVLAERFGDRFQRAYQPPRPGLHRTESDGWPDIADPACIHGHAIFDRFAWVTGVPDASFVVFLRDPLAGAVSLWRYKKRTEPRSSSEEPFSMALDEYLLEEYNNNRYCQWIARSERRLEEFLLAGVVERFDESMEVLCHLLGWPAMNYGHENRSEGKEPAVSISVRKQFRTRNAEDYALWQRAQTLLDDHRQLGTTRQ